MLKSISKALALPRTLLEELEEWRQTVDALRGPPSELKQSPFQQLRGPPSELKQGFTQLLMEGMRKDAKLQAPDAHAAPAKLPPAPTVRRGSPRIHDWSRIKALDAKFCRTYFAANRAPTWKERREALRRELGSTTPHLKTLQRHLPKIALLKERNLRSI